MDVCFRVDSSVNIGSGHVMRCLALADELRARNVRASFICRQLKGSFIGLIEQRRYKAHRLPRCRMAGFNWQNDAAQTSGILNKIKPGWLIVDHYKIDSRWEKSLRPSVNNIMAIDDLASREHECDILLDQNLYAGMRERYKKLLPGGCKMLLGPRYALLRGEFKKARAKARPRDGNVKRILVFFGGVDLSNETGKTLKAIAGLKRPGIFVDAVIGLNNPHKRVIEQLAQDMPNVSCHHNISNISGLMLSAGLYVGTAGITTWERCCLGLPSLVITIAENQVRIIKYLAKKNILFFVGKGSGLTSARIGKSTEYFLARPGRLKAYSLNSLKLVDGSGASRCARELLKHEN